MSEPVEEKLATRHSHEASRDPSTLDFDHEKTAKAAADSEAASQKSHDTAVDKADQDGGPIMPVVTPGYASGIRLGSIVLAIVLAMFLVALDMTSEYSKSFLLTSS